MMSSSYHGIRGDRLDSPFFDLTGFLIYPDNLRVSSLKKKPHILWLEDHPTTVNLLREEFERHFGLDVVSSVEGLSQRLNGEGSEPDAVLLDMELADGFHGSDALRVCREAGHRGPVLVLSNDETLKSRIQMLSFGVDDYLWKAMDPEEMLLRIQNAIRRHEGIQEPVGFELEGLRLNPVKVSVEFLSGDQVREIPFSKTEFHFLMMMLRFHPEPVEVEQLRAEVWRLPVLEHGTINTFIWKMNKKLEDWTYRISKNGDQITLTSRRPSSP
jgi:DNA-binding response OmpR family regulator